MFDFSSYECLSIFFSAFKTGIVMGVFILCWLPFFVTNILMGVCPDSCISDPELVGSIVTWLGWLNSGMNPVIYACWSRDFRRAFKKILCSLFSCCSWTCFCRCLRSSSNDFNSSSGFYGSTAYYGTPAAAAAAAAALTAASATGSTRSHRVVREIPPPASISSSRYESVRDPFVEKNAKNKTNDSNQMQELQDKENVIPPSPAKVVKYSSSDSDVVVVVMML